MEKINLNKFIENQEEYKSIYKKKFSFLKFIRRYYYEDEFVNRATLISLSSFLLISFFILILGKENGNILLELLGIISFFISFFLSPLTLDVFSFFKNKTIKK